MRFRRRIALQIAWMLTVVVGWSVAAVLITPRFGPVVPIMSGLFLGMIAFAARRAVRRIAWPIELLTAASRRFGAGDLSTRVTMPPWWRHMRWHRMEHWRRHPGRRMRGLDEIIDLGDAWNDMAARIEKLVQGQRELLANVSHELRSPLARVRVALELLPRTPATEKRFAEVVADLEELDHLIDEVLTASRLEGGTFPLRPDDVDVADLLAGLAARAAHDPLTSGKELRVDPVGVGSVRADAGLLRRALWNLVENAAKYGAPPIVLAAELKEGAVVLSVTDAGPGIPAEARDRVLEPFVRLDEARTPGTTAERRGIGLGLTIAGRAAEAHGGRLTLEPACGDGGLRASITLPV